MSARRTVQANRKTGLKVDQLRQEVRKLLGVSKVSQSMVSEAGFKGKFATLSVLDLEKWYLALKGEVTLSYLGQWLTCSSRYVKLFYFR